MKHRLLTQGFLFAVAAGVLAAQPPPELRPGPLTDGSTLLTSGWRIRPAGTQVPVGSFPLNSTISPDGKFLLTVNSGEPASISVIRADTRQEVARQEVPAAWQGITFSPDGRNIYIGSGARNSVFEFAISPEGRLALTKEMTSPAAGGFLGSVAIPPGGRLVYAADVFRNVVLVFNPQSGRVIEEHKTGRRPFQILFHPDGESYFVSSWADASVYAHHTNSGEEITRQRVALHPTGMVLSDRELPDEPGAPALRLFVAAASTNNVYVLGVDQTKLMRQLDVLNIGFTPALPAGMAPTALTLSKDQTRLYVACANVNAIAVADVSEMRSRLAGFIPTGAYPSSIQNLGDQLAVTNAHNDSVSVVPAASGEALAPLTDQALALVEFNPSAPAPAAPPVENAMLVLFDSKNIGVNFRNIAKSFGSVVNFYRNAPGLEGMEWTLSGLPSDYIQRMRGRTIPANDPANLGPAGSLVSNAKQARIPVGEYGPELPRELPDALPRLTVVRLSGTDADRNLGRIVETLSKSPEWRRTALFLLTDTTPLYLVSPYTRTAPAPSGMFYNHSSVLRTIELILKLRPMTVFDASARPLTDLFSATANLEPYTAEDP